MITRTNDRILYIAFVCALAQLNSSQTNEIQLQLDKANDSIAMDINNINQLDLIAENYPVLNRIYQDNRNLIDSEISQMRKPYPPDLPNKPTPEISNVALYHSSDLDSSLKDVTNDSTKKCDFTNRIIESIKSLLVSATDETLNDLYKKLTIPK